METEKRFSELWSDDTETSEESRLTETEKRFLELWSDETETSEDEIEVFSLVKLFGYDKNLPPILTPGFRATDIDDDSDSDQDMTDEEYRLYSEQVEKSDGFDVEFIPGVNMLGQIGPVDIEDKRFFDYDFGSQLAVDEYRLHFKDEKRELEFVTVLKVMAQVVKGVRFYITFEAKDLADGDKIKIYQAVVSLGVGNKITVKSFRLKPPEDGQGTGNHGKEWFWVTHLCHGGHRVGPLPVVLLGDTWQASSVLVESFGKGSNS